MIFDFLNNLQCVRQDEEADYNTILNAWKQKNNIVLFMPAITFYPGTVNLFDQKAGINGKNMIWFLPAGQCDFWGLDVLKKKIVDFYETDHMEEFSTSYFPEIAVEEFEECILLHSNDLQNNSEHNILGANVILVRFSLLSGRDALVFILLDHQDQCWSKVIEDYRIALNWFVDSGRGTGDYYARVNLYPLMKNTPYKEILPALYFKGLYNKGETPEGFQFQYAMLSQPDSSGYDKWRSFSAVFDTGWKS